ncbi:MAG: hypothetical protein LUE25_03970 [Clostridiales bacterium]|nr:hypothetical protein [Clostridia bacterium]MCD8003837.1 hypothetical protein [Clostridia bacterium]MCD8055855.1 hypothetical protein [Clostridiales bacterium]
MFGKSKAEKELKALTQEIDANLSNNYRAPAQAARVKFGERIDEMKANGEIDEKTYKKWKLIYGEYCEKMEGFGH